MQKETEIFVCNILQEICMKLDQVLHELRKGPLEKAADERGRIKGFPFDEG